MPSAFTGREQALAWFDAEHAVLVATVLWASTTRHTKQTLNLAAALSEYQAWRRHSNDRLTVSRTALDVWQRSGLPLGESIGWINLGLAFQQLRRFDEAVTAHERALRICQDFDALDIESMAWTNLGLALAELLRFDEARRCWVEAAAAFTDAGSTESAQDAQRLLAGLDAMGTTDS